MSVIHVNAQYPRNGGRARIAFVGEAPSDIENEKGYPFAGPSGRVFDAMMRTANLDRYDYLVTNVFDEQLPDNEVSAWTVDMKTARDGGFADLPPIGTAGYLIPEHRWHLERLAEELRTAQPNVIVAMGNTALWALTGLTNISGYRGTTLPAKYLVPGAKVLPTYHPAFVIQQWKYFSVVVGDFMKAEREAKLGREIVMPKRDVFIMPTVQDLHDHTDRMLGSELLSVDIETGWGQIKSIGFAPTVDYALVVPFIDKRVQNRSYWKTQEEEVEAWKWTQMIMESRTPKLGQNFAGYDFLWLWKRYGIKPYNMKHDTRLMHHVLYPELEKSLEFMGNTYATQLAWKHWGASKAQMEKRDD